MVSVAHSSLNSSAIPVVDQLAEGLTNGHETLGQALDWVQTLYADHTFESGEKIFDHAVGMALIAVALKLDLQTRLAALLFAVWDYVPDAHIELEARFGVVVTALATGVHKLRDLRLLGKHAGPTVAMDARSQTEILRKMLLAMVEDIRVVLLRLASRAQTLRYFSRCAEAIDLDVAQESLDLYAPLANRLGVWQLKWELEDLAFRFLQPQTYKQLAKQLDERRIEREAFIETACSQLRTELSKQGLADIEVYGRPKHIYSIYNKMRAKHLDFSEVYDVRALRVIVATIEDCYTALGVVHQLWQPIEKEFDDYIINPKGNAYQSLHTAVRAADGRALEVQIRTQEMHRHAELGVAAHWRYKEGESHGGEYDEKIALLRELLSWREEIVDHAQWKSEFKRAAFDDTIYVLTPQGRVIDLAAGATPIDFAYRLHTDLGHRCRGAKVDGQMVPLNRMLENGQRVEIIAAKQGGPSRDWLNPQLGYLVTSNARAKVRRWFVQQDEAETAGQGRAIVMRELQRDGHAHASIDDLAAHLGFKDAHALFLAVGRGEVGTRQIQTAFDVEEKPVEAPPEVVVNKSRVTDSDSKVLVVGVGKLMTSLSRCCKPAPPDSILGFVTRGRGVSVHRRDCISLANLLRRHPERIVPVEWGNTGSEQKGSAQPELYPVDISVEALDRQALLRDISDVFSREKLNVTAVNTLSKGARAFMRFTVEITGGNQLQRVLNQVSEVKGVIAAKRA